jgi:hypothetical protein
MIVRCTFVLDATSGAPLFVPTSSRARRLFVGAFAQPSDANKPGDFAHKNS